MPSAREKGNELERKAKAELEAQHYRVERALAKIVWIPGPGGKRRPISQAHDFFGAFDLIAVKRGQQRWVQVCMDAGNDNVIVRRRKIEALALDFWQQGVSLELWRYRAGRPQKGDRLPRGFIREFFASTAQWLPCPSSSSAPSPSMALTPRGAKHPSPGSSGAGDNPGGLPPGLQAYPASFYNRPDLSAQILAREGEIPCRLAHPHRGPHQPPEEE